MKDTKQTIAEAALLYYKKKLTQQQIAEMMHVSRQTVSKWLSDAEREKIVEITVFDPQEECAALERSLTETYGLKKAIVCTVSGADEYLRQLCAVRAAARFLTPLFQKGGQKIAISWGRTVESLIEELDHIETDGNVVFPLFGATDTDRLCFSPNELARNLADKLNCRVKNTWFPYLPDSREDGALFCKTSYYRRLKELWKTADVAVLGIGDTAVLKLFQNTFGTQSEKRVIGDIATHFFTKEGVFVPLYEGRLCASIEDLKQIGLTVAIACGDQKAEAIRGALNTGLINILVTDEYTARKI